MKFRFADLFYQHDEFQLIFVEPFHALASFFTHRNDLTTTTNYAEARGSIDLTKPWDDPANKKAYETNIATYRCPSADVAPVYATYVGLVGQDLFFTPAEPRSIKAITDGTSNTLAVIEVAQHHSVHWMSPEDGGDEILASSKTETYFSHAGGFQALLADGSVRFLSQDISTETLTALTTVAGGEMIGEY